MALLKSNYYDQPEGKDAFGKLLATNTYALCTGLFVSTIDVLMYTKTQGYLPTLARFAYNTGPMMGMATAFTLTTYAATNVRGKDDRLNYFLGGMAAGGVYGSWRRSTVAGLCMGLFFGIAGTIKKLSIQEGWEFFPPLKTHEYGSLNGATHDFTIMKEPPRNWTTEPIENPNQEPNENGLQEPNENGLQEPNENGLQEQNENDKLKEN